MCKTEEWGVRRKRASSLLTRRRMAGRNALVVAASNFVDAGRFRSMICDHEQVIEVEASLDSVANKVSSQALLP